MGTAGRQSYCFGPFRLEPEDRLLVRDGQSVPLTAKTFDALLFLVERGGHLVSRDDLITALWPETFVDESNLTQTVSMMRKALGDNAGEPRYIITVPGRGYRFAADVQHIPHNGNEEAGAVAATAADVRASVAPPKVRKFPTGLGIAVVLAVGLALGAAGLLLWGGDRNRPETAPKLMLAVLPFENLTGDATQDYLSDGFTEEMITDLGRLDPAHLGVIARTSVMHYRHTQETTAQIARELGVQYVLEGSVRRNSGRVRITAQLIQSSDQTDLWAREYDRELRDLLLVQGEIAQEIADEIQLALGAQGGRNDGRRQGRSPGNYEAYDLYLKGRYFWNERTPDGFRQAVDLFQQAAATDPRSARAYAGLADAYLLSGSYGFAPSSEVMPKARAAALKAAQLDDSLAEAHTSLALVAEAYDWDWQTADKEFRRAIQLDPNYATAHHWYAECLAFQGRFDEALTEIERARQLDPLSLIIAADRGAILYFARQYDRAIEQFRSVLDVQPDTPRAHLVLFAYAQKGRFADALSGAEQWRRVTGGPWVWAAEAYIDGRAGRPAQAERALRKLQQANRHWHMDPAPMFATAYAGMNQTDRALAWLQTAYAEHSNVLITLKVDPVYDPLRSDPRFKDLMRRVGFIGGPPRE